MSKDERAQRLRAIRSILGRHRIGSQAALLEALREAGFRVTQATLSRDLRSLDLVRRADGGGGYLYTLADHPPGSAGSGTDDPGLIMRGLRSIEFSGALGVVKTLPGHASGIASGSVSYTHLRAHET